MAEGFKGTVDFVGYSVGEPPPPPPAGGFIGLLDFTGIPVGTGGGAEEVAVADWLVTARRRLRR